MTKDLKSINDVYITSKGDNNKELFIISALSEGDCEGIEQKDGVNQVFIDGNIYTDYGDNVSYTLHLEDSIIMWKFIWDESLFCRIPKHKVNLIFKGKNEKSFEVIKTEVITDNDKVWWGSKPSNI